MSQSLWQIRKPELLLTLFFSKNVDIGLSCWISDSDIFYSIFVGRSLKKNQVVASKQSRKPLNSTLSSLCCEAGVITGNDCFYLSFVIEIQDNNQVEVEVFAVNALYLLDNLQSFIRIRSSVNENARQNISSINQISILFKISQNFILPFLASMRQNAAQKWERKFIAYNFSLFVCVVEKA